MTIWCPECKQQVSPVTAGHSAPWCPDCQNSFQFPTAATEAAYRRFWRNRAVYNAVALPTMVVSLILSFIGVLVAFYFIDKGHTLNSTDLLIRFLVALIVAPAVPFALSRIARRILPH